MSRIQISEQDILQPVPPENIPDLLEVLRHDLPQSIVAYSWIRMQLDWEKKMPYIKVYVLCPHGDWRTGTVLAFTDGLALEGKQYGVVYAREGAGDQQLAEALKHTRAVPWHTMIQFTSVHERHVPPLLAAARAAGVNLPPLVPLAHLVYFPLKVDKFPEIAPFNKPGYRRARLSRANLEDVWSLRPLFPDCFKPVIAAALEHNASCGIFAKQRDGSELLVSMVVQGEHGGGALWETHPDYQHRGLSMAAVPMVVPDMMNAGYIPYGTTWTTSTQAIKMIEMNGMKFAGKTHRVEIVPGNKSGSKLKSSL